MQSIAKKNNRFGIISILPPNIPESNYIHRQIKIENKIKLDISSPTIELNSAVSTTKHKTNDLTRFNYQIPSVYANSKFNWIHYLILNYDVVVKDNIDTPHKAFEHWTKKGMREKRRSIIHEDEILENLHIYKTLKTKIKYNFLDEKIENKMKSIYHGVDKSLFDKYKNLFHKYLLDLRDPNSKLIYSILKKVPIKQKFICAIHCYDLNFFVKFAGDYLKNITKFFDIIVTFVIDNEIVRNSYNFTFILTQNIGGEIGGKFIAVDYLKCSNVMYEHVFFFNSNINKKQNNENFPLFISKLETIQYFLKHDKLLGGVFPNIFSIGEHNMQFISKQLESIINTEKYELINWGTNLLYASELINYLEINNTSHVFSNASYYILHKSVAEFIFGDKNLYNILNDTSSFDYNWVNLHYKVNKTCEIVYREYKINNWHGNAIDARLGKKSINEAMIENAIEKIVTSAVVSLGKKIKIIGTGDINSFIENYMNDFDIEKTRTSDFCYIKKYLINSNDKFDWEIYLLLNKDLEKNGIITEQQALNHWHNIGKKEGRVHCDVNFDWEMYLLLNKDVKTSGVDTKKKAYLHWIKYGKKENRKIHDAEFDWEQYLLFNPDLIENGCRTKYDAYKHWINCGQKENRICKINLENSEEFNSEFYLKRYQDLKENGYVTKEQLYMHWIKSGKSENRIASIKPLELLYNNIIKHKTKIKKDTSHLNITGLYTEKNDNYVVLKCEDEDISYMRPHFKTMEMITQIEFNKYENPFILIIDFDYRGGGATHFLNVILQLYKKHRQFLIIRRFEEHIYFYINDYIIVHNKYSVEDAINIIKKNKDKIQKIFINSIVSHDSKFLNSLFELNKKITSITHDYSLIFDKWNCYYHEYVNKKKSCPIDVNCLDKLITQNEANMNIYSLFLKNSLPIVIAELPDYKHSLHRIETNNKKTVVGIIGNISEIKGFYLVYKLIETFKESDEIEIVIFGRTNIGHENEHPYSNVDELNKLLCKHKPNIWIETSLSPETYSYTLTLTMLTQLPILYQKKPFPSVIENRLLGYKNKYDFENIEMLLKNPNLITDRKQNHFYTIDNRIYSNSFWDSYFSN